MKQQQEKSRSPFAKAIRNFFKSGVATAGAVILTLVVLMAIFADVLAPFDPNGINIVARRFRKRTAYTTFLEPMRWGAISSAGSFMAPGSRF